MSAAVAFTRATMTALSASVRVTGPLADLMYSVLPSTLSMVPATRWVCCCADAVETANTAAKAAAATIRIVLMSDLPKGDARAEHTAISLDGEAGAGGGRLKFLNLHLSHGRMPPPLETSLRRRIPIAKQVPLAAARNGSFLAHKRRILGDDERVRS